MTTKSLKAPKKILTPTEIKAQDEKFMDDVMDAMMMSMMMIIVMMYLLPRTLSTVGASGLAPSSTYQGRTDQRNITTQNYLQWLDLIADPPYTAWVHCFIINDGPGAANIAINHPNDMFVMGPGETRTIDRSGAAEKILTLFYVTGVGQAHLRVTGEY